MKLVEVAKRLYQYRDHFEVNLKFFKMMDFTVVSVDCEGE